MKNRSQKAVGSRQKAEGSMRYFNLEIANRKFPIQLTAYCLVPSAYSFLPTAF